KLFQNVFHEFNRTLFVHANFIHDRPACLEPFRVVDAVKFILQMPCHLQNRYHCQCRMIYIEPVMMKANGLAYKFRQVPMSCYEKTHYGVIGMEAFIFFKK